MNDPGAMPDRPPAGPTAARDDEPPPNPNRRALGIAILVVLGLMVAVALATGGGPGSGTPTFPPVGATAAAAGPAAEATRGDLARALQAQGLLLEGTTRPYRPAEAAVLASAPRLVVRAVLPDDPTRGNIVIYDLGSPTAAHAAGQEQAAYVASGVGRVQFPSDARFVIRVVGPTVVFFSWSPADSLDPRVSDLVEGLETVGTGVPIPG